MSTTWQKTIIQGRECIIPFDLESEEALSNFRINQPLVGAIHGTNKERSVVQLNLYWKACEVFAENTNETDKNTKKKADWWARNSLCFFDPNYTFVRSGGTVSFKVRSISFKNLKHIEACDYFERAYEIMAGYLGVPVDVFINEVKSRIGGAP